MSLKNISNNIDEQFVEDYELIKDFMNNVNNTLSNISIKTYDYNEFCIDIKNNIFELILDDTETITNEILINALNNMIKYRILEDENYEDKIKKYFDDPSRVLDDINILKLKNIKKP